MKPIVTAVIAATVFVAIGRAGARAVGSATAGATEPYQPGLGEIMALQQMRHIKLWYRRPRRQLATCRL